MGLIIGTVAGALGLTGFPVIVVFLATILVITYIYTLKFLEVDDQDYKPEEIFMEGFANSAGLFMVSWISFYSYM